MDKCPCYGCPDRAVGCHSAKVCKRGYPEWEANNRAKSAENYKRKCQMYEADDFLGRYHKREGNL